LKVDIKGLKFKNWAYLMMFSLSILAVLWVMQFGLFNRFYVSMKTREAVQLGDEITNVYLAQPFASVLQGYAFDYHVSIVTFQENSQIGTLYESDKTNEQLEAIPADELRMIYEKFETTGAGSIYYYKENESGEVSRIIYVARYQTLFGQNYYLYINNTIPPTDSTVPVLRTQFFLMTLVVIVFSVIAAQLFSKRMSRPIIRLTGSAKQLAKGKMDVTFAEKSFTEIEELSSALNYATQELSKLDAYRKDLVANVSHDLKTPLTVIRLYSEMLRDLSGEDPEKRREHCELIIKEADWLTKMVNELLELSKLQEKGAPKEFAPVDLSACLTETLESFRALSEKEGYRFSVQADENCVVTGNEAYLKRVLYNLISNAAHYTGDDKHIFIFLKKEAGKILFKVIDTGAGIPEHELSDIWNKYYKASESHRRAVTGTGLGLSIVKSALELHGAAYGVTSKLGEGSTFWFEMQAGQ
jgi:signal transduction histidine kinase